MKSTRRELFQGVLGAAAAGRLAAQSPASHSFGWRGADFLLDSKPFVIRSGSLHYPRIPRPYWRDRMRKMKALGLNTLCTYVFWNLHEPEPGKFDFSSNLDLAEFIRTAHAEGLWVVLRPGPYVCAEWDFGGFPAWLLATPDLQVRSADPKFLAPATRYIERVGRETAPLQITHGGPILMVQVENEYGSYGSDKQYLGAIQKAVRGAGFDVQLFTSDGSGRKNLEAGTLDDCLAVINMGDQNNPAREFENFAQFRRNVPRMAGEYWPGWFDHWGERHHTTPPERSASAVDWMLSQNISFNLYMVHGGTNFGFMAGANDDPDKAYEPTVSSYDYDAPIDEAGRPSAKFRAVQAAILKHLPAHTTLPALPDPLPMISVPRFELLESAPLLAHLGNPLRSERPVSMETAGQSYGYILYRVKPPRVAKGTLAVEGMHDYAVILQGGKRLGVLDSRLKQDRLEVDLNPAQPLDILVENMGRANFGPNLPRQHKGITGKVTLAGAELTGWEIYPLPLTDPAQWPFAAQPVPGPALHRGSFQLNRLGDTFLDMRGWGKGVVWVNGHCLGRYWRIGPQQTQFVPAPWLRQGANEAMVLDLEDTAAPRSLHAGMDPVFETPAA
jgi:beta-galactosidase